MIVSGEGKRDSLKNDEETGVLEKLRKEHQLLLIVYCARRQ